MKRLSTGAIAMGIIVACGGSSGGGAQTTQASSGAERCALAYYPPGIDARCQQTMDYACCAQEQACAAANGCMQAVECVRRCPDRRSQQCEMQCFPQGNVTPGARQVQDLFACGKNAPFPADATQCRM